MSYSADTFVADEIPTTAKWNKLWNNDASFNDGSGIAAGAIGAAPIAAGAITPEKLLAGAGTTWPWQSWTPAWTNVTIGNATVVGQFCQVGKAILASISFIFGSTTSITGNMRLSLPALAAARYSGANVGLPYVGTTYLEDAGIAGYSGFLQITGTNLLQVTVANAASTYLASNAANATAPFTWGVGDFFTGSFSYEAA